MKILIILLSFNIANATLIKNVGDKYSITKREYSTNELALSYAKIQDKNLIYESNKSKKMISIGANLMTKEELDLFVSRALHQNGFSLLDNSIESVTVLVSSRDLRYKAMKSYTNIEDVPKDYHFYQFTFATKYLEASEMSRNMRPFLSRYGRIVDEKYGKTLSISDTGINIHRIYELIKIMDTPKVLDLAKQRDEINSKVNPKLISEDTLLDVIKSEHVLFILIFSIMGVIVGFGIRGYMMKKIEGGW